MAKIAQGIIDLGKVLADTKKLTQNSSKIDNSFEEITESVNKMSSVYDKFNRSIQATQRYAQKLGRTFSKIQDTLRFIAITPFSKLFAGITGGIQTAFNLVGDAVYGSTEKRTSARAGQTTARNLEAYERAIKLGGMEQFLSSGGISNFKENMNKTDFQGALAYLGSINGLTRDQMNSMDTTDLMVKSLTNIDKFIQKNGGYNSLSGNALASATQMLDLLGIDMQTLRAANWKQFNADYAWGKGGQADWNVKANTERSLTKLSFKWGDLKDRLLQALMPSIESVSNSLMKLATKITQYLIDNKIIEKVGDKLKKIADWFINTANLDKAFDFIVNELPQVFNIIGANLLKITGWLLTHIPGLDDTAGNAVLGLAQVMENKNTLHRLGQLDSVQQRAIMANITGMYGKNALTGANKNEAFKTLKEQLEYLSVPVININVSDPNLKVDVTKSTAAANISKGR